LRRRSSHRADLRSGCSNVLVESRGTIVDQRDPDRRATSDTTRCQRSARPPEGAARADGRGFRCVE
jgi:hypothetical protein